MNGQDEAAAEPSREPVPEGVEESSPELDALNADFAAERADCARTDGPARRLPRTRPRRIRRPGRRPVWNVLTPVVALVEADTAEQARRVHRELLEAQGHQVHEHGDGGDAFESETLPDDLRPTLRADPSEAAAH